MLQPSCHPQSPPANQSIILPGDQDTVRVRPPGPLTGESLPDGFTPLALACRNNDWASAELLLDYGARVNARMELKTMGSGNTLLHLICASRGSDASWINFLGDHGADPDAENSQGLTPMHYALGIFSSHKIRALAEIGASCSRIYRNRPVLHTTAIKHSASLIVSMIDAGASIDCCDSQGRTALHYANMFRSYRVLETVLDLGANPNAQDHEGNTPLHTITATLAEHCLHPIFIDLFLTHGARLNTRNDMGETVMHKLPWSHPSRTSAWLSGLVDAGAWVNVKDHRGRTPLMLAERYGDRRLTLQLIRAGAKGRSVDKADHIRQPETIRP